MTEQLCACGCGLPAPVMRWSNKRWGWEKGKAQPYRQGHHERKARVPSDRAQPNEDGCLVWTGSKTRDVCGYGTMIYEGRRWRVHRLAWMLANGPIPDGACVMHTCDNSLCVNPAHLRLGSHQDNMADRNAKDRHARGERHADAKLTDAQVLAIRDDPRSQRAIGADYGVSATHVCRIKKGYRWRHLAEHRIVGGGNG